MNDYRLRLKLLSPMSTNLWSDVLFGHICWALRFLKGKKFLEEEFLPQFDNHPPFLISDGFVSDTIVKPILPQMNDEELKKLIFKLKELFPGSQPLSEDSITKKNYLLGLSKIKGLRKKVKSIPIEIFFSLQNECNEAKLIELLLKKGYEPDYSNGKSIEVTHNTINRIKSSVLDEGGLFTTTLMFYKPGTTFDIYVKVFNESYLQYLQDSFEYICKTGFGKDKSIGKGWFEIASPLEKFNGFGFSQGEWVVSLSSFALNIEVENIYYNLKTKFGRVYMKLDDTNSSDFTPFKKPVIMLESGSIVKPKVEHNKKEILLGGMLSGIHKDSRVKHYCYGFPVRINLKEG